MAVEPQNPGEKSAEAEVFIGPLNSQDDDRMDADPGCGQDARSALRSRRPPDETHAVVGSSVAMTPLLQRSVESPSICCGSLNDGQLTEDAPLVPLPDRMSDHHREGSFSGATQVDAP